MSEDLFISLEVLKRWETLAALGAFFLLAILIRFIALGPTQKSGFSLKNIIPPKKPTPQASAEPSEDESEEAAPKGKDRGAASKKKPGEKKDQGTTDDE